MVLCAYILLWIGIGLLFWVYLLVGFEVWVICLVWFCGEAFDVLDSFCTLIRLLLYPEWFYIVVVSVCFLDFYSGFGLLISFVCCFGGIRCWLGLFGLLAVGALYYSLCFLVGQWGVLVSFMMYLLIVAYC